MKSHLLASLLFAALAVPAFAAPTAQGFDNETVGAEPKSFAAAVGHWVVVDDTGNKRLSVNGAKWARGQTSAGLADKARIPAAVHEARVAALLHEEYHETDHDADDRGPHVRAQAQEDLARIDADVLPHDPPGAVPDEVEREEASPLQGEALIGPE